MTVWGSREIVIAGSVCLQGQILVSYFYLVLVEGKKNYTLKNTSDETTGE